MREKLVVVGNGMAGMRTVEELLALAPDLYDITVFGAEPHGNYNRILLSPLLTGETTLDQIMLNRPEWYAEHGITLHVGAEVSAIDRRRREVVCADGRRATYDRLLIATGSRPVMLPVPGRDLPGVIAFRDVADVEAMLAAAGRYRNALVIGGGLLGLEAAAGLAKQGMQVRVAHIAPLLLERQLDHPAAGMLREALERRGIEFLLEANTRAIHGDGRAQSVEFADGRVAPADLVVMAAGIRPNIDLARAAGIHCERGIVVNDTMQSFDPRIYAVGECVQHRGQSYGLVAPLFEMARVCANHLARMGIGRYTGSVTSTKLKVTGIDLFSAGDFHEGEGSEAIVLRDPGRGVYKKVVLRNDRVQGAVLYGDTADGPWYFQLMREGADISAFRHELLFGQAHVGDAGHGASHSIAAMGDEAVVCGCNGVTKGHIVRAIREKGLFTLDEVRLHTKASASCGGCTGLVEQILAATVGSDYSTPQRAPLCACTDLGHDEVRAAIRERRLTSMPQLFEALAWRTPDGCPKCRPALNFYLLAAWPLEARDDTASRFVNERLHANIQKDRSYTVVPRLWGGVVSPQELRAIADAAEKYEVPLVKITGGQRIDLVGLQQEQLPAIWADLNAAGMVSGHAYGKALRTVKTCIGSRFCRFGTQDAIDLGIRLEKLSWGSWTPHKFKMAVSGCPRNCAEATIKDFGVVAVEGGFELHVGGNGGTKVRVTDFLCKVSDAAAVLEYCAAFMQLYREEAHYLERTAPWLERVGLGYVKSKVVDDASTRSALAQRFLESQGVSQVDPWAELVREEHRGEFVPVRISPAGPRVALDVAVS